MNITIKKGAKYKRKEKALMKVKGKIKKEVKRNNLNSISCYHNSTTYLSRCSNIFKYRK